MASQYQGMHNVWIPVLFMLTMGFLQHVRKYGSFKYMFGKQIVKEEEMNTQPESASPKEEHTKIYYRCKES